MKTEWEFPGGCDVRIPVVVGDDTWKAIKSTIPEKVRFLDPDFPVPNLVYNFRLCDPTLILIPLFALQGMEP